MTNLSDTHRLNVEYVHSMLRELRDIAAGERCEILTYFIEMAYKEATDVLRPQVQQTEKSAA